MKEIALVYILLTMTLSAYAQRGDDLRKMWLNPPLEYRMNRNIHNFPLDPAGQKSLISKTLDDGWGGFALNVPFNSYLTDKGMKATRHFCELAKAKGMDLWLYDEQGYPSGNAGGRVIAENPTWKSMGLFFTDDEVNEGNIIFKMPSGKPVLITAFPIINGKADYTKAMDLMDLFEGPDLKWKAPKGKWLIFAATKHTLYKGFQADRNPYHHPSPMIPGATDAFLRITHERYAEYMGNDLGKYFTSTFTDEPSSMAIQFHTYPFKHAVIPWHEILSLEMMKRYGYRPEEKLIELYYDNGPSGQKVRYQYFKTVGDLTAENYFGRIRDWCHLHNFKSGGHLLLEETMVAHVPLYGDIMQCFRAMDAPGIDILSCYPENMPVHSPKLASSAAELTGRDRIMSEPCPVADGPDEPPVESVRGHINMLLQGGVTDFNCYLRLKNFNRTQKNEINTYVARAGMMLRSGHSASQIGVVYPVDSLWTKYTPRYHKVVGWKKVKGATHTVDEIDKTFQDISRFMFDYRWEYLFLDSKALIDGEVEKGKLALDTFKFSVIILPSVSTLPSEAWSRLLEYANSGGKMVFMKEMPLNSDVYFPDTDIQNKFAKYVNDNSNAVFMKDWTSESLNRLLNKWLEKPVKIEDENLPLRLAHKKINSNDIFFLINDSAAEISTDAHFHVEGKLEEWDPATGRISTVLSETKIVLEPYHGKIYRSF